MRPLQPPKAPTGNPMGLRPAMGNFSPNDLGVGALSAPMTVVAGTPKVPGAPGVPRIRRKVMGKMKATLRPKAPRIPKAGDKLQQIPGPNLAGIQ